MIRLDLLVHMKGLCGFQRLPRQSTFFFLFFEKTSSIWKEELELKPSIIMLWEKKIKILI